MDWLKARMAERTSLRWGSMSRSRWFDPCCYSVRSVNSQQWHFVPTVRGLFGRQNKGEWGRVTAPP